MPVSTLPFLLTIKSNSELVDFFVPSSSSIGEHYVNISDVSLPDFRLNARRHDESALDV
ncbi:hypothetical protein KIN20_003516 [Parelaphostrongylus tenuis]|uniref:Uncharacterized protein n=1 Tax=Parelaphostrongylus tenuis TaxID=148309 RepID=A0AAD5M1L0_PARTN|nr:hypothetical protein KIN20_003516 [Parelaphostrongylus tenuis]